MRESMLESTVAPSPRSPQEREPSGCMTRTTTQRMAHATPAQHLTLFYTSGGGGGAGTVLRRVSPAAAAVATVAVTCGCLVAAYSVDSRVRRLTRAGDGAYRPGWYSPGALMSLRISPITRVASKPPATTQT